MRLTIRTPHPAPLRCRTRNSPTGTGENRSEPDRRKGKHIYWMSGRSWKIAAPNYIEPAANTTDNILINPAGRNTIKSAVENCPLPAAKSYPSQRKACKSPITQEWITFKQTTSFKGWCETNSRRKLQLETGGRSEQGWGSKSCWEMGEESVTLFSSSKTRDVLNSNKFQDTSNSKSLRVGRIEGKRRFEKLAVAIDFRSAYDVNGLIIIRATRN